MLQLPLRDHIPHKNYILATMITFSHFVVLALVASKLLPKLCLLAVPGLYILFMAGGTFRGGQSISRDRLVLALSVRWKEPEQLASYMRRYWFALRYSGSASARQRTCTSLAMIQIGLGLVVLWKASIIIGALMLIEAGVLWLMATRVNRPLSMYKDARVRNSNDPFFRNEWRTGVAALLAYAELYPESGGANFIADHLLGDELVQEELSNMLKSG